MDNLNVLDAWNYFSESFNFNKFLQQTVPMTSVVKHIGTKIFTLRMRLNLLKKTKKIVYGGNTPDLVLNLILLLIPPLIMHYMA